MIVKRVTHHRQDTEEIVYDSNVGNGYIQEHGGSLPDVDTDFQADRRQEIKEYIERRYNLNGKQRVFSAGTYTTLKLKAVLKDVARVHRVPIATTNYITAIFPDDKMSWTDLFILAKTNAKVKSFIDTYPQVIEDIRTLMGQPRSASIHASALLVTPTEKDGREMECFDFTPIKKVDGMLISEWDGYSLDEQGLLKNDCLGIKELSKIQDTITLCNREYAANITFQGIVQGDLSDTKTYELFQDGNTQNVFQFSSKGMIKFIVSMKPTTIDDLIAANALFRPATLQSGSAERFVDCKKGDREPTYLWGTYNALKETYGEIVYQEQLAQISREVGGLSLGDGVKLVKFISKKKVDKIHAYKERFMSGASEKGCPKEEAERIWSMFESAGSYLFNKSHATAYAVTAYAGAWLKANYPTAFYTVALQYADKEEIPIIISEMEQCSNAQIVAPNINVSDVGFTSDYRENKIFWSLSRIKMLGAKATDYIIQERSARGAFQSVEEFIDRVFRYKLKRYAYWDDPDNPDEAQRCPVNARHIKNLIVSGCFDEVESISSITDRFSILNKAAERLGFEISEKDFPPELRDKHYFWSLMQISTSGIGSINYKKIYDDCEYKVELKKKAPYAELGKCLLGDYDQKRVVVCASVVEAEEKKYKDKTTGENKVRIKMVLQQNNDIIEVTIWNDEWLSLKKHLSINSASELKGKIIVSNMVVKFSQYSQCNQLNAHRNTSIYII